MAQNQEKPLKNKYAEREEEILSFWAENKIFEKTLAKKSPKGEFIFYEGPPTANGRPGIHHLAARAFKDLIPRFKTMQGFHVRRKGGWDTHGLPVELEVEKQLSLTSKKQIEEYGIAKFNQKCRESVWKYVDEWAKFTDRSAYWVDLKDAYVTYKNSYIESLWNILGKVEKQKLLYKDYRVVPWCPRCETALSSHELAQGYQDVKDLSVYVKFEVVGEDRTYLLAWTTTPWTLAGNVALAVGKDISYVEIGVGEEKYILAKDRLKVVEGEHKILREMKGKDLLTFSYKPLYPYLNEQLPVTQKENIKNAYKVYAADFVTTEDGTGIVHTAVMYGQDDFALGTKIGLPKHHLVDSTGHFVTGTGFLEGKFARDEETAVAIIKDLAGRNLLFKKEKYQHSYPHCWRCKTALIYYARDSWYIRMSDLKDKLVKENEKINWEPAHVKEGRFGEWIAGVKDWAISRERYWGTPLPVWVSKDGSERLVVDSIETLKAHTKKSGNNYFVMRHGESERNVENRISSNVNDQNSLTKKGIAQVEKAAKKIKKEKIDLIVSSPFLRTKETASTAAGALGISKENMVFDPRIGEIQTGEFDGGGVAKYHAFVSSYLELFTKRPEGGENLNDLKKRVGEALYDLEKKYHGKNILIVTHEYPAWMLAAASEGLDPEASVALRGAKKDFLANAEVMRLPFVPLPHNDLYELDLHRPYIDEVALISKKGMPLTRAVEVMDVWFDSGSMPFAQDHYPFENKKWVEGKGFPADYICEAVDQTRGWFYTLHAVGTLLGRGRAFKNVICLGLLLDKEGKKMSKSVGNVVNPWEAMDTYSVDTLRFWMYSINQPGDAKNFDEKTVQEVGNKVFNLLDNVVKFFELYKENISSTKKVQSKNMLDQWILALFNELVVEVTKCLEAYDAFGASRAIREFIAELSQWYIRRSRDRFKSEDIKDREAALAMTRYVLLGLSKLMAPFTPFFAENVFQRIRGNEDEVSVHLALWPKAGKIDTKLLSNMKLVREAASRALLAREEVGIKVRQPLQSLTLTQGALKKEKELLLILADEVNVKEILFDESLAENVKLDTTLTETLREEGVIREFVRGVQDLRKKKNLTPTDVISLTIDTGEKMKKILEKHQNSFIKTIGAKGIKFESLGVAESLMVEGESIKVSF